MGWIWTTILRISLKLKGIAPNGCTASGPVKLDLKRNSDVILGKNIFFRSNIELKIRDTGTIILGDNVRLDFGVRIVVAENFKVQLENNVEIGFCSLINGGEDISVGEGTAIGGHCILQSSEHVLSRSQKLSVIEGEYIRNKIIIGKNCWLASFVLVRPGVVIGNGSMIGAFSLVNSNVPEFTMFAGIPAVKKRNIE